MNFIKFWRDVVIWISNNYSSMPVDFQRTFSESMFVIARIYLSDVCDCDSEVNKNFSDYD